MKRANNLFFTIPKKTGMIIIGLLMIHTLHAQLPQLQGSWMLDSVQVWNDDRVETWEEYGLKSGILTGYREKFDNLRLQQLVLQADNKASFVDVNQSRKVKDANDGFSDAQYSVKADGKNYLLEIGGEPDTKTYDVTVLSENQLLLTHSFSGGFVQRPVAITWKFFYSKKDSKSEQ